MHIICIFAAGENQASALFKFPYGVMVALLILVQPVEVRVLVREQTA